MRAVDDQAWLNMMGQWYVVPTEDIEQQGITDAANLSASVLQMMDDKGIDPNNWLTDLKVVGEETLVDTQTTHMSGSLDIQKMFTDVFTLMQDPEFTALLGDVAASDSALSIPDASEMQELQDMIGQMFNSATFDLWLADADNSLRKLVGSFDATIPQEMGMTGISGVSIVATVNLDAPGATVEVTAPASAQPMEQLTEDMANNPLLSGLGGLLGGGLDF